MNSTASVTAQERMDVVKQILQNLEKNGIMGDVTLVDVSVPSDMQMWYGEKYQIKLGDSSRLAHKIESMQTVFLQQEYFPLLSFPSWVLPFFLFLLFPFWASLSSLSSLFSSFLYQAVLISLYFLLISLK